LNRGDAEALAALCTPEFRLDMSDRDTGGIGYISLEESDWPFRLGAELVAAGFDVDLNLLR
jgi:hypothetical protein